MKDLKWTRLAVVVIGIVFLSTPPIVFAASSNVSALPIEGALRVGNQSFKHIAYANYHGATYIKEAQLVSVFDKFGLNASFSGGAMTVAWLGQYHSKTKVDLGGSQPRFMSTMTIHGNNYLNASELVAAKGWRLSFQASTGTLKVTTAQGESQSRPSILDRGLSQPLPVTSSPHSSRQPIGASWGTFQGENVATIHIGQTDYIGVWYVIHVLNGEGFSATFHRGALIISQLPTVVDAGDLSGPNRSSICTFLLYHDQWFAPLSAISAVFGWIGAVGTEGTVHMIPLPAVHKGTIDAPIQGTFSVSISTDPSGGTVSQSQAIALSFLLQDGTVDTQTVTSRSTTISIPGKRAIFMGYQTANGQWIGVGTVIQGGTVTVPTNQTAQSGKFRAVLGGVVGPESVTIRDVVTHASYRFKTNQNGVYSGTLPFGVYDVWTIGTGKDAIYVGSRFLVNAKTIQLGTVNLPSLPTDGYVVYPHSVIEAQNQSVTGAELINTARLFESIYHQNVDMLNLHPELPVVIDVFHSSNEFTQHFLDEAYGDAVSGTYGADAQAVTESAQSIALNAANLGPAEEMNVVAHEFTHVLFEANQIRTPTWLNEGIAWHMGMHAEIDNSPSPLLKDAMQSNLWSSPLQAAALGQLASMVTTPSVGTAYNLEAQDNFAVNYLIDAVGWHGLLSFVESIQSLGVAKAFSESFHESESKFAQAINQILDTQAARSDAGLRVTLSTLSNFQGELFVSNPQGKTYIYAGAAPNQTYQLSLMNNGTVEQNGLILVGSTASPIDGYWDIGIERGTDQEFFSLQNRFGHGYLETTDTFLGNASTPETSLQTQLGLGLTLNSITPLNNASAGGN